MTKRKHLRKMINRLRKPMVKGKCFLTKGAVDKAIRQLNKLRFK